ncbi:hypothetical protein, partial [Bacillus subtilis]|uniref:hypothetical protein n=1 Tax=Bacillus subtilis TaxID=1423 RepID=UPI0024AD00BA
IIVSAVKHHIFHKDERKKHNVNLHGKLQKYAVCISVDGEQKKKMWDYFIIQNWNNSKMK